MFHTASNPYGNQNRAIKGILIVTLVAFVLQLLPLWGGVITRWGALRPFEALFRGQIWRFGSYALLHSQTDLFHIIFNMLGLWWFGAELEERWGSGRFLRFYIFTALFSGVFSLLFLLQGTNPQIVGASGAILALLTVYAIYYPDRQVLLFFVLPVKVRYVVIGYAVFSLLWSLQGAGNIAHITHLGGILAGGFYYLKGEVLEALFGKLKMLFQKRESATLYEFSTHQKRDEDMAVDDILKKISKLGMNSLTSKERKILEKASEELSDKE